MGLLSSHFWVLRGTLTFSLNYYIKSQAHALWRVESIWNRRKSQFHQKTGLAIFRIRQISRIALEVYSYLLSAISSLELTNPTISSLTELVDCTIESILSISPSNSLLWISLNGWISLSWTEESALSTISASHWLSLLAIWRFTYWISPGRCSRRLTRPSKLWIVLANSFNAFFVMPISPACSSRVRLRSLRSGLIPFIYYICFWIRYFTSFSIYDFCY